VYFEGELGSGKTFMVEAMARKLGVPKAIPVVSPTFALVHTYTGTLPIIHADLYRVQADSEVYDLGLTEMLHGGGVLLVEWGLRFAHVFGNEGLLVELSYEGQGRTASCKALGAAGARLLHDLCEAS